jgi:hypothetical protein
MVDRLAAAGLVERIQSPIDARSVLASLTSKGSAVLAELAGQHVKELLAQEPLLAESLMRLRAIGRGSKVTRECQSAGAGEPAGTATRMRAPYRMATASHFKGSRQ